MAKLIRTKTERFDVRLTSDQKQRFLQLAAIHGSKTGAFTHLLDSASQAMGIGQITKDPVQSRTEAHQVFQG